MGGVCGFGTRAALGGSGHPLAERKGGSFHFSCKGLCATINRPVHVPRSPAEQNTSPLD